MYSQNSTLHRIIEMPSSTLPALTSMTLLLPSEEVGRMTSALQL
jgi:hypothetical protein